MDSGTERHYIYRRSTLLLETSEWSDSHLETPCTHCLYTKQPSLYLFGVGARGSQRLRLAIFPQDDVRPHVARDVQEFFFTNQIELLH
ncbi:hypothetical protein TNCV_3471751 [Trichonephila clavipes]|nr:hypothetical protein TNCV_3471751 [Trichonephila clavipes]